MNQSEIERLLAPYPDMLTVEEVATVLRVHRRSVQRWASQGRFTAVRAGRTYRIPRADVLRWIIANSILLERSHIDPVSEHSAYSYTGRILHAPLTIVYVEVVRNAAAPDISNICSTGLKHNGTHIFQDLLFSPTALQASGNGFCLRYWNN